MGMNKELQEYYDARFEMFASKGWKDLIIDVEAMRTSTNTVSGIEDIRKLGVRQGEISIMDWLISLERLSMEVYKEIIDENIA